MTEDSGKELTSQVQKLALNAVALATGGIVAQLAIVLIEVLVARELGAEIYGVFVTAYAWTVFAALLMEFGTSMWTIEEGSRDHSQLPHLLGSALTVNLVVFSALYFLLYVVLNLTAQGPVLNYLMILLPYGLILTIQSALAAVYSSYQAMHVNAIFQALSPVAILAFYFAFSAGGHNLADVGAAYVIGGAVVTGYWLVSTIRKTRPWLSPAKLVSSVRHSYQYGLTSILSQVFYKTDIVMLSMLAGLREAGIYAAAFKLVDLLYKVAILSGRVFAPAIFKASRQDDKSFSVLASMMLRFLALAGLAAGVISFVLADELILFLFGEDYRASAPVLRILGGVMATNCMLVALQLLLSSIAMHVQRVSLLAITVIVQLGANALLIPKFGAQGAAAATLFGGALVIFLYAMAAATKGDFQFLKWLFVPACLAIVSAVSVSLIDTGVLIRAVVAVSVFVISLLLMGFARKHEIKFIFETVFARK